MNNDDLTGRFIAQVFWSEIEKIAEQMEQKSQPLVKEEEIGEVVEVKRIKDPKVTSPGQMFGVQISKHKDGTAKMQPLVMPVPGYTFNPELQKFVPNMKDAGWMTSGEAMIARAKREGYIQAKKEEAMNKMQTEAASFIKEAPQPTAEAQPAQPTEQQPAQQQAQQPAQQAQAPQQATPQAPTAQAAQISPQGEQVAPQQNQQS